MILGASRNRTSNSLQVLLCRELAFKLAVTCSSRPLAPLVIVVVGSAAAVTVGTAATYTNVGATAEANEVVAVSGIVSYQSVWAKLTPSTTRSYTITTAGSSFDTVLAVYSLSANAAVNVKNAVKVTTGTGSNNDCSVGVKTSCVTVSLTSGKRYFFQIDGNAGATGTIRIVIN